MAGIVLQGGGTSGVSIQGGSSSKGLSVQGSAPRLQSGNTASMTLQPAGGIPSAAPAVATAQPVSAVSATQPAFDPAAAASAAAATAKSAQLNALKGSIQGLVKNIHSVYDAIYGNAQTQAGEKVGQINDNFGQQENQLTSDFGTNLGASDNNFSARGAADSSYHADNRQQLTDAFNNGQTSLEQEKQGDIAGVGSALQSTQQGVQADSASIDQIMSRVNGSTDPDELQSIADTINDKLATLKGGQSAYNTQAQNVAAAPTASNNLSSLSTSLKNIVAGTAPDALKLSVGTKLIQSAGLSDTDKQTAIQQLQASLSGSDDPTKQQVQ